MKAQLWTRWPDAEESRGTRGTNSVVLARLKPGVEIKASGKGD